ncbi:MAG: hypothetical protein LBE10_09780 [Treponema sp.]|jgi:hypothetical protein|nr:hypothetical protein [Treponema sp.]
MRNSCIEKRTTKTLHFLKDKNPGNCLFTRDFHGTPVFGEVRIKKFMENPVEYYLDKKKISGINDEYLKSMRRGSDVLTELDDDAVPDIALDFSQGTSVSLLCGLEVKFVSDTGWCKPEFAPEEIDLNFKLDNPRVQFHLMIREDLIKKWDDDFLFVLRGLVPKNPLARGSFKAFKRALNPEYKYLMS